MRAPRRLLHSFVSLAVATAAASTGLFVLSAPAHAAGCTRTWTGAGDGLHWDDAANWGGTLPAPGDDVCWAGTVQVRAVTAVHVDAIQGGELDVTGGSLTLDNNAIPDTLTTLVQTGGTLGIGPLDNTDTTPTGDLTVSGAWTFSLGWLGVRTLTMPAGGAQTFTWSGGHLYGASAVVNDNTIAIADNVTDFMEGTNGHPSSLSAVSLALGGGIQILASSGPTSGITLSTGLTKAGASGSIVAAPVVLGATGTVAVTSGALTLQGPVTGTAPATLSANGTSSLTLGLPFGGPAASSNVTAIGGTGTVQLAQTAVTVGSLTAATANIDKGTDTVTTTLSGNVELGVGATLVPPATSTVATLNVDGGVLGTSTAGATPAGAMTVSGDATFSGGTIGIASLAMTAGGTHTFTWSGGTLFGTALDVKDDNLLAPDNASDYFDGPLPAFKAHVTAAKVQLGNFANVGGTVGNNTGITLSGPLTRGTNDQLTVPLTLTATGSVSVPSGNLTLGDVSSAGSITVGVGANLTTGAVTLTGGTAQIDGNDFENAAWTLTGGTLKGIGTFNGLVTNNGGTVAPGDSPGLLTVQSYVQTAGTLALEITGTTTGLLDQLKISGSTAAAIAGTIAVTDPSYSPTAGTPYEVVYCQHSCGTATVTATVTDDVAGLDYAPHITAGEIDLIPAGATVVTAPGAPGVTAAATGTTTADVTVTAPASNGGAPITGYALSCTPSCGSPATTTGVNHLTGLLPATAYTVSVTATNGTVGPAGTATFTTATATHTGPTPTAPTAPAITGVAAANAALVVTFTPPTIGAPFTGFTVTATPVNVASGAVRTASGSASPITVGGLTNGAAYTLTVHATNPVGTGPESAPVEGVAGLDKGVSLLLSQNPVAVGQPLRFYGYVADHSAALAGVSVTLVQRLKTTVVLGTVKTDAHGQYTYTLKLTHTGAVRAFAIVEGQKTYAKELLGKVSFIVKGAKAVTKGASVVVTGTLTPGSPFAKEHVTQVAIYRSDATGAKKGFLAYAKLAKTKAGASQTSFSLTFAKSQLHGATYVLVNPLGTAANYSTHIAVRVR